MQHTKPEHSGVTWKVCFVLLYGFVCIHITLLGKCHIFVLARVKFTGHVIHSRNMTRYKTSHVGAPHVVNAGLVMCVCVVCVCVYVHHVWDTGYIYLRCFRDSC